MAAGDRDFTVAKLAINRLTVPVRHAGKVRVSLTIIVPEGAFWRVSAAMSAVLAQPHRVLPYDAVVGEVAPVRRRLGNVCVWRPLRRSRATSPMLRIGEGLTEGPADVSLT